MDDSFRVQNCWCVFTNDILQRVYEEETQFVYRQILLTSNDKWADYFVASDEISASSELC